MSENQVVQGNNENVFRYLLYIVKRYIVLILVVTILATAGGVAYSYLKKPVYTASNKVAFQARTTTVSSDVSSYDINIMRAYIDTVVDFCDEGVVVDRANYYYVKWLNEKRSFDGIEEFLRSIDRNDQYNGNDQSHANMSTNYFNKGDISTATKKDLDNTQLIFSVKYKDEDKTAAEEKVQILTYAFAKEIGSKPDPHNPGKILVSEYFTDLFVELKDLGYEGVSSNSSKIKTVIMFFAIGLVVGFIIANALNKIDTTLKSKDELESISGTKILSVINKQ